MNCVERLMQKYSAYQTRVTEDGGTFEFVILNPNQKSDIVVDNTSGLDEELTFYFSYQHVHFGRDVKALTEYIDLFLTESKVAIEFFRNEKYSFGGSIYLHETNLLSAEDISRHFGYKPSYLVGLSYKVCSWSGANDLDAVVVKEDGHIICKRN